LAGIGGLWILKKLGGSVIYRYRNILNRSMATRMLAERNEKTFDFKEVKADELKSMDVYQIRKALMEKKYTSVDLVHYFGNRCQTLGREMCLTTEELFESAMKLAEKCDKERTDAISNGE
jgi:hypothetical protein